MMPELPDVTNYVAALRRYIGGHELESVIVRSPFVLRTFDPEISACAGARVLKIERLGKRLVLVLTDDLFLVVHLMITGRFHWKAAGTKPTRKSDLAAFGFHHGCLMLTEAGQKKRASLHVHRGRAALAEHDRGGLDVLDCTLRQFAEQLRAENRTLKRMLTNPSSFDGIGNAFSDEILHAAGMSPLQLTRNLSDDENERLFHAARNTLQLWIKRLQAETGDGFPEKVTAFHPQMAVHGRFGQTCHVCSQTIQRIVFAEREINYCPGCQTGGRILKDRSLSRLLKDDWPDRVGE